MRLFLPNLFWPLFRRKLQAVSGLVSSGGQQSPDAERVSLLNKSLNIHSTDISKCLYLFLIIFENSERLEEISLNPCQILENPCQLPEIMLI